MANGNRNQMIAKISAEEKSKTSRVIFLFILLHLLIAIPLAYTLNIWVDEASSLNTTQNGFYVAFQNTLSDEKQAPLYFWMLSIWRYISESIFFARLFSILSSLVAIGFFYRIVEKLWSKNVAVFAIFFFTLHPYLFWASLEIRVYSLIIMLTLLLLNLFFDGFISEDSSSISKHNNLAKKLFPIAAIVSLYSNYYLGFILVACFVVLLILRRWKEAKTYLLQMILVGIFFLPLLWAIKTQLGLRNAEYFEPTNFIEGLKLLWGHFLTLTLPTEIYSPEQLSSASFFRLWIVRIAFVLIAGLLLLKKAFLNEKFLIFGTISAVVMAFLYYSYFLLGGWMFEIRHVAVLFPTLLLLMVSTLILIAPKNKSLRFYYFGGIAILLTCSYSYALVHLHPNLTKLGDWERVGEYIEQNERAGQPIIIFPNFEALALPYHYKGENQIFPKENFHKWFSEAEYGTEGTWTKQTKHYVSIIPKDTEKIWFVTYSHCHTTNACVPLEKYIEANYTTVKQKDFYNERVRLLKRK